MLSCAAGTLLAVARSDPTLAMSLFQRMELSEERLLATRDVYRFISYGLRKNFAGMRPVVERMLRSSQFEVCRAGARLAGIAALTHKNTEDLVDEALQGDPGHRLGVAEVASANIDAEECRDWCEAKLIALFDDDDANVRRKVASCFSRVSDADLGGYEDMISAFCDSKAFREDSSALLHALEKSLERLPGMTCVVCEKFLDYCSDRARDIRTASFGGAYFVLSLVFRTYQQHQDDEWTSRSHLWQPKVDLGGQF